MRHLLHVIKQETEAGHDLVLATITASSGSTPRGAGSHMLIGKEGILAGTIGGGAIEYRAIRKSLSILERKISCQDTFLLNHDDISELGMVCGGEVQVFFHYLPGDDRRLIELCKRADELYRKCRDIWLIRKLDDSAGFTLYTREEGFYPDIPDDSICKAAASFSSRPKCFTQNGSALFLEQIGSSGTVYLFGGGHISQRLAHILATVDFRCVVLDDRPEFVDPKLFPDAAETILCDFSHLGSYITVSPGDYCCVLTRGHSYDTVVQAQLLQTPASYIGVIGSRKKKATSFERLVNEFGFAEEDLVRITTPIGLSIQAETPEEIAISIAGQLIQARADHRK